LSFTIPSTFSLTLIFDEANKLVKGRKSLAAVSSRSEDERSFVPSGSSSLAGGASPLSSFKFCWPCEDVSRRQKRTRCSPFFSASLAAAFEAAFLAFFFAFFAASDSSANGTGHEYWYEEDTKD